MAFKHWQGKPPEQAVAWKCPSCGQENVGKLEAGCVNPECPTKRPVPEPAQLTPFDLWWIARGREAAKTQSVERVAQAAFEAGYQAGTRFEGVTLHVPVGAGGTLHSAGGIEPPRAGGGRRLAWSDSDMMPDPRIQETIVAALAFYRDNQLAYGGVPGQLSAAEVDELIADLSPAPAAEETKA